MGDSKNQLLELKRAVLKGELAQQADIPLAHIELGKLLGAQGNIASKNAEFDKAMTSAKGHLVVMKTVEQALKTAGDTHRAGIIAGEIMHVEAMIKQANATPNTTGGTPPAAATLKL